MCMKMTSLVEEKRTDPRNKGLQNFLRNTQSSKVYIIGSDDEDSSDDEDAPPSGRGVAAGPLTTAPGDSAALRALMSEEAADVLKESGMPAEGSGGSASRGGGDRSCQGCCKSRRCRGSVTNGCREGRQRGCHGAGRPGTGQPGVRIRCDQGRFCRRI